jgi:6-pyruvoyltetrahydropterin/6-carboxytetrahydropterin synthase
MYEVTVEAGFSSGHYLRNYKGKCENPHGHNYKVRVTLAGAALDEAGLLLDFKLLKQVLRPVIERIDHQMLNDLEPFTVLNPSAENIAKYFYDDQTNLSLPDDRGPRAREGLHDLGDGHDDGYLLRVADVCDGYAADGKRQQGADDARDEQVANDMGRVNSVIGLFRHGAPSRSSVAYWDLRNAPSEASNAAKPVCSSTPPRPPATNRCRGYSGREGRQGRAGASWQSPRSPAPSARIDPHFQWR